MKKTVLILSCFIITILITGLTVYSLFPRIVYVEQGSSIPFSFGVTSIHTTITMEKDGEIVFKEHHPGNVTKLGLNFTFAKLTGNTTFYNATSLWDLNLTHVSIGNQGTLDLDSTELPGEWNRTAGNQHTLVYNGFNITAVFYPDSGPYTADCLGINYESGIGNGALWGYDTFTEATGIDDTYTITIEIQVSAE